MQDEFPIVTEGELHPHTHTRGHSELGFESRNMLDELCHGPYKARPRPPVLHANHDDDDDVRDVDGHRPLRLPEPVAPPAAARGGAAAAAWRAAAAASSSASWGRLWKARPPPRQSPGGRIWRNGRPGEERRGEERRGAA